MTNFSAVELKLKDAYLISNYFTGDDRGSFSKIYEKDIFHDMGIDFHINETFFSISQRNVIRGLHFQLNSPQAKLVTVISGRVWDVIVDLRMSSKTYGEWAAAELSGENHKALYVPKGFGHGFLAMENNSIMLYQCEGKFDKESDTGIRFDDMDIAINWPVDMNQTIHSQRDLKLMTFKEFGEKYKWGDLF